MKDKERKVDEILNRGIIAEIIPDRESFKKRLLDPKPMKIYIGLDPTSTSLHLGHAENLMLLEEFRKLGHEVILLFGNFTARIGDPTDKITTRKQLSAEEVSKNVEKWIEQVKPLMGFGDKRNPPRIVFNGEWLSKLTLEDVVGLASNFTVQQMLNRDMFAKRMKDEVPIYLHEFLYPLMQGYDSIALEADAELGGTDQTFNALVGRELMRKLCNRGKFVVVVNLMANPKTGELMSKSRGTGVFIDSEPFDLFGSIMAQPDEMTKVILINNTRIPLDEIESILRTEHPRDAKMRAAFEVTRIFHGEEEAEEAKDKFVKLVQRGESVGDLPEVFVEENKLTIFQILRQCLEKSISNSQIRRLINQGAVEIDGSVFNDANVAVEIPEEGMIVRVGKKQWFKVIPRKS